MNQKSLWKNGQINLEQLRDSWGLNSPKLKAKQTQSKTIDSMILDIKRNFCDLMRDIESLTEIDYPKMLSQKVSILLSRFLTTHQSYLPPQIKIPNNHKLNHY